MVTAMDRNTHSTAERSLERRQAIALRLLRHRARTQTVRRFTGLSTDRLSTLRYRSGILDDMRLRGPSPYSLFQIMRSRRLRQEAATVACLCVISGALPLEPSRSCMDFDLATADRLCDAYELFIACIPHAQLTIEHAVLLVAALRRNEDLTLVRCPTCCVAQLLDRQGSPRGRCTSCGSIHVSHRRIQLTHSVESTTQLRWFVPGFPHHTTEG